MKRILLHLVFWLCYFAQFAYMSVLWDKSTFPHWPMHQILVSSVSASALFMLPQMIFPYYMIYFGIKNIIRKKYSLLMNILGIALVFFLCVVLDRFISSYIALPYIYKSPKLIAPIFEPRRLLGSMFFVGFAFGLMFSIKSVRNQLEAKEREKNLIKEKLETELKFLKNQTNPHFLLNTLNNIYALARKKSGGTADAVMRLSELLRFMLYESTEKLIKLADEIKVLDDYLELETIRYNKRLTVSFEKIVDSPDYKITPLLLLPFLENAFKHGISETRFESFIYLNIKVERGVLDFEIENSKDEGSCSNSAVSIGLINVRRQLELTYHDYSLDVKNEENVFMVHLTVNLYSYAEI